jgi:hypothetical protein
VIIHSSKFDGWSETIVVVVWRRYLMCIISISDVDFIALDTNGSTIIYMSQSVTFLDFVDLHQLNRYS